MKKKGIVFLTLSISIAFLFCGCGTKMHELTADEQELIVQYSAYALGRFNAYQKDGMQYYIAEEAETLAGSPEPANDEPGDDLQENVPAEGTGDANQSSMGNPISFADAIGYGSKLLVAYQGFDLQSNYKEGNYFSIDAKPGCQLFIAKFEVKNISDAEVVVNAMEQNPTFRLSIDGGSSWINEDVTLLLYDLSTYYGTINASDTVECVLLFEIPADKSVDNGDVSFSVVKNGAAYPVN